MQFYDRRILSYLQKIIVTITPMEIAVDTIWRINVLIVLGSFQFTFEYGAPKNIILSTHFTNIITIRFFTYSMNKSILRR
jgi:hypothetical protein